MIHWCPAQTGHLRRLHPFDALMFRKSGHSLDEMAQEGGELHVAEIVEVVAGAYLLVDVNLAEQLLLDLPLERLLRCLARFDLATGKLPIPGERLACAALRAQHLAIFDDGGSDHFDQFRLFHASPIACIFRKTIGTRIQRGFAKLQQWKSRRLCCQASALPCEHGISEAIPKRNTQLQYAQSLEQVDPQLIARTLDEGSATDQIDLLDVLYELMERKLYPNKEELDDDEHTEVAWALEDGAYSVTRIRHDSPLYHALFRHFNGNEKALTDALAPSIIDELSADLYSLMTQKVLAQRIASLLARND